MGLTETDLRRLKEQSKIENQLILSENLFIKDVPIDNWKPFLWTNNFIQQGLSRLLGWESTRGEWLRLNADTEGNLLIKARNYYYDGTNWVESGLAGLVGQLSALTDRDGENTLVIDSEVIDASGNLTHVGLEIASYAKVSVLVSTTTNCTIYPQVSDDNVNFYDVKTSSDGDITFNCSNEKICFELPHTARYLRMFITNAAASAGTVSVCINGQV